MQRSRSIGAISVALLWLFVAGAAAATEFPKGTFASTGPDGLPWGLTFDGEGRFLVTRDGNEAVEGAYKAAGDEVEFRDEKGPFANETAGTGTYKWTLDGGKLTFTKIQDANGGRSKTLTAGAWEKD